MDYHFKPFAQLTTQELYDMLQLRSMVFVVEQNCPYLDVDGLDLPATHHFTYDDYKLLAYTRTIPIGHKFDDAIAISRVVVHPEYRTRGLGLEIMAKTISFLNQYHTNETVRLSAQFHLQRFYASLGFEVCSEMYLEDDIPHVEMVKFP